jgi:8-oxo-dGTP pyrophosphatase MutT (NUDIX family)
MNRASFDEMLSIRTRTYMAERLRRLIGGLPCRTQVAALPWRVTPEGPEVLLVTSRGTGRWVIPKGWPEGEEQFCDAAAREALEEAGVAGRVDADALGRYYYAKHLPRGREWRCEVRVYPLHVEDVADKWRERKKRKRQWFAAKDAARLVDEPDLAELIRGFANDAPRVAA